jgi:NTE family protein
MTIKNVSCLFLLFFYSSIIRVEVKLFNDVFFDRLATELLWKSFSQLKSGERPRVVLVLGGGGARGLSHIGVLKVLEEERIPIDEIVGVSVGALIGALYAAGIPLSDIEKMAHEVGWDKLTDFSKISFLKLILSDELLSSEKMERYLNKQFGDKYFTDLKIPFTCVATDIRNGERVVFREGPVAIAARASATVPAIFKPVEYRQRLLVDGGLVDNLPTDEVNISQRENSIVVAVIPTATTKIGDSYSVFQSFLRSIDIQKDVILDVKKKSADFLIEPLVGDMGIADLNKGLESIESGTLATRLLALDLKKKILRKYYQTHNAQKARP